MVRNRLKTLLELKGLTQKEFAEITGIRQSTISELCRNSKSVMNLEHLEIIMKALNITDFNEVFEMTE